MHFPEFSGSAFSLAFLYSLKGNPEFPGSQIAFSGEDEVDMLGSGDNFFSYAQLLYDCNPHKLGGPGLLLSGLLFAPASEIKKSENQKIKNWSPVTRHNPGTNHGSNHRNVSAREFPIFRNFP